MNYIGYDCPVCKKAFAEGDDIVVCPVCGAPHHRACYQQQGGCGLEFNHAKGIAWEDQVNHRANGQTAGGRSDGSTYGGFGGGQRGSAVQRCPSCGSTNPADGIFCQVCGTMMRGGAQAGGFGAGGPFAGAPGGPQVHQTTYTYTGPSFSPYGGMNPEDTLGEATVKEVATYIGPSSGYYLSRFRLFNSSSKRVSTFSWSAFLFSFMYFFYRKVYRVAVPLLIIFLFSMIPSFVYSYEYLREISLQYASIPFPLPVISTPVLEQLSVIANIAQMANFIVSFVMGFTAHRLYLQDINRKIAAIKAANQNVNTDEYIHTLSREGGVSTVVPAVLGGLLILAYFGGSMAIAAILHLTV